MAWSFYCADEKLNITANTKEELATKVMQHLGQMHDKRIDYDQAMEMVNREAKQTAA